MIHCHICSVIWHILYPSAKQKFLHQEKVYNNMVTIMYIYKKKTYTQNKFIAYEAVIENNTPLYNNERFEEQLN